jgi:acetyltransferase-like isoleucine patch superfamily enzyme
MNAMGVDALLVGEPGGRLVTSPLLPQALRRRPLARGGVRAHRGASGPERCCFESGEVTLGADTQVNAGCWFEGQGRIDVASHCLIGADVLIVTSTHRRGPGGRIAREATYDAVSIGAVVTRDCEAGHLYDGIPARRLR